MEKNKRKEDTKIRMIKLREERKEKGLCGKCGKENDRKPKYYCSKCAEQHNKNTYINRVNKILNLICPHCGKQLEEVASSCFECSEKTKARNKKRHNDLIAKGLCVWCAKPTNGFKKCDVCREKENSRRRSRKS